MTTSEHSGRVVARYRRHVTVEDADGRRFLCQTRSRALDPLAGDEVRWRQDGPDSGVVDAVLPRHSALTRVDSRGRPEVVAANVTQLIAVAAAEPEPDWFLLDRYLAAAELADIRSVVVFNKIELMRKMPEPLERYREMGYAVHLTSAVTGRGMEALAASMRSERSVVAGQSGVGKSSLINGLLGDAVQVVGELGGKGRHGRHTTTTAALYRLPDGGELIDSPGVRSFAPFIEDPTALARGFRDFRPHVGGCRFDDCRHLAEPECAVKRALDKGAIDGRRYQSYRRLYDLTEALRAKRVR
jgi:ribosome biogenesis GTPase / thiamine phosphate phosphatase